MTTVAIMQPTFLPWCGYFHLAEQSDVFVFLDDVQLENRSWQTRNRLIFNQMAHWISVPVSRNNRFQTISETKVIDASNWRTKLLRSFSQNYKNHPFYADAFEIIDQVMKFDSDSLALLNESVIKLLARKLKIETKFIKSSSLEISKKRTDKLIAICEHFQAEVYLSPKGSREYLEADCFSERTPIRLSFQDFSQPLYEQKGLKDFVPNISVLDMIANIGFEGTAKLIRT